MRITEEIAEKVIERVYPVVRREISITNDSGVVVGSSDRRWIGKSYREALQVIKEGHIIEVETADGGGTNFPIFLDNRVIGVLWITGRGKEVRDIGRITSVAIELLLHRRFVEMVGTLKEHAMNSFVTSLFSKDTSDWEDITSYLNVLGYDPFLQRISIVLGIPKYGVVIGRAIDMMHEGVFNKLLRYDVREKILSACRRSSCINEQDILTNVSGGLFAIFKVASDCDREEDIQNRCVEWCRELLGTLKREVDEEVFFGIGFCVKSPHMLKRSFRKAVRALEVGILLSEFANKRIFLYNEPMVLLGNILRDCNDQERRRFVASVLKNINSTEVKNGILLTLRTYLECGMNTTMAAERLFIHKNTLLYRLDKVKKLTGLNPHNPSDMFYLWLALQMNTMNSILDTQ